MEYALLAMGTCMRLSLMASALAVVVASTAQGQPTRELRPSSLGWVRRAGAEACPGPAEMARKVEGRLHRAVFVPAPRAELAVEASVEPATHSGWHVVSNISGSDGVILGQRELASQEPSCAPIAESAVLAIALMIDPEAVLGPDKPPEPEAPKPPLATIPVVEPAAAPAPWESALEVSGGAYGGLLPKLAAGFFGRVFEAPPSSWLALELGGGYFVEQALAIGNGSADFSLFLAELAACSWPARAQVTLSGCGGVQVGVIGAAGANLSRAQNYERWVVNFAARAAISFRASDHWLIAVNAQAIAPLYRDTFTTGLEPPRDVFRMSPVAGGFELGLGYAF